jgi:arylsulfatase A-like enzyme
MSRVIAALRQEGVADNTLIILIEGDNGSSVKAATIPR